MPEGKYFTTDAKGPVVVIHFPPRSQLSGVVAEAVGNQLYQLVEEKGFRHVVLNFANVSSLTSLIIGKLIHLYKKVQAAGGRVVLCEVTPVVLEILDLLRLTTMLPAYSTEQEALESVQ